MRFVVSALLVSTSLVCGCGGIEQSLDRQIEDKLAAERASNAALVNKVDSRYPVLITAAQRLREQSEGLGSGMFSGLAVGGMPRLQALGKPVQLQETVLNAGANATGLKFILSGAAIGNELVEGPKFIEAVSFYDGASRRKLDSATVPLRKSGELLTGQASNLRYESLIELSASLKTKRIGDGALQLDVQPLTDGGKSAAQFSRVLSIKPEDEVRRLDW